MALALCSSSGFRGWTGVVCSGGDREVKPGYAPGSRVWGEEKRGEGQCLELKEIKQLSFTDLEEQLQLSEIILLWILFLFARIIDVDLQYVPGPIPSIQNPPASE